MPEKFQRPVRKVSGPLILVGRKMRLRPADGRHRELPMSTVPPEQRTGMLRILFVPGVLEINGPERDKTYLHGAHYGYRSGCAIYVEILPRGASEDKYATWVQRPPFIGQSSRVQRLSCQTPVVASREAEAYLSSSRTSTDQHLTLVPPKHLGKYLRGVLPYIGVDPSDLQSVIVHVEAKLEDGKRKLRT